MNSTFNPIYIQGNELIFYIYLISMLVIIILTAIFVVKELKKK